MKETSVLYYDKKYSDGVGFGRKPAASRVHMMLPWLRGRVLDIGCGMGQDCAAMRQHGLRPTGVDYSSVRSPGFNSI
jgi:2-polyprenyl-3-methyl-5-hydroxy-6-metoxy-1,4-benzoquinol methylase